MYTIKYLENNQEFFLKTVFTKEELDKWVTIYFSRGLKLNVYKDGKLIKDENN